MYRTILLCYDGSPEGQNVLTEGAEIACASGARTHLLAVVPLLVTADAMPAGEILQAQHAQYEAVLNEGVAALTASGLAVQGKLAHGRPVDVIADYAREIGADLIVLGHRPQGTLARWWRGAVDHSLLSVAPCSILVAFSSPPSA
ncbi:MAG: universal stress protein [Candidatus Dactylopiibacterium sp.]|nr:universal stress protein [Candidatus Dactylopiibacterium sp.]